MKRLGSHKGEDGKQFPVPHSTALSHVIAISYEANLAGLLVSYVSVCSTCPRMCYGNYGRAKRQAVLLETLIHIA